MRTTCLRVAAALFMAGCDGLSPVPSAPTPPVVVTATQAPVPPSNTLAGVVRVAGIPTSGAKVALLTFETGAEITATLTDTNGSYSLSEVRNVSPFSGALVSVSKAAHFTETRYIPVFGEQRFDFELERADWAVTVGEAVQAAVVTSARCASLGYGGRGGAACQRFVITTPTPGVLEILVSSSNPAATFDITLLKPDGSIAGYVALLPLRAGVEAGLTYQIDVVHVDPSTREFVLRTAMR